MVSMGWQIVHIAIKIVIKVCPNTTWETFFKIPRNCSDNNQTLCTDIAPFRKKIQQRELCWTNTCCTHESVTTPSVCQRLVLELELLPLFWSHTSLSTTVARYNVTKKKLALIKEIFYWEIIPLIKSCYNNFISDNKPAAIFLCYLFKTAAVGQTQCPEGLQQVVLKCLKPHGWCLQSQSSRLCSPPSLGVGGIK